MEHGFQARPSYYQPLVHTEPWLETCRFALFEKLLNAKFCI